MSLALFFRFWRNVGICILLAFSLSNTCNASQGSPGASDYAERQEVQEFLSNLSREQGIPLDWLTAEVAVARYSRTTEKLMTPKPRANKKTTPIKNWRLYRRNLVSDLRIINGKRFLARHKDVFDRVEAKTGVSRYAVASIIGIESVYGYNMGRFRVIDALMTLSFDYTRRAAYYKKELATFLAFCWKQDITPYSVRGSFAGAMGMGQFMPSSLAAYGTDGDGDGHIDIVNSDADAIASVANFLKVHGWVAGEKPLYPVKASRKIFKETRSGGIRPHTTVEKLLAAGVEPLDPPIALPADEPVLLVDLPWVDTDNRSGTHWFIGTRNFAAILHYNRSYFYAAAVSELADALKQ